MPALSAEIRSTFEKAVVRARAEAEAYVAALREEILGHIQDGKPVLI